MIPQMFTYFGAACQAKGITFIPTWYKYLDSTSDESGHCSVEFLKHSTDAAGTFHTDDLAKVLLAVVEILLRVGAMVAIGYVVWGGIQYIMSQGEPDKIKGSQETIKNALIGLVIAIFATGIVNFIGTQL